ncbi:Hypothetical protein NTJ_08551 [Nesidiocoris tenuis]|uniref:Uncharacterized protein n=1 Tax=Nesidiocoris tenuis TaxID=355587 RepID=A0ABN7AU57_9HEMI|nr:Hypothetical protein NTJ_08551 [Nesidiocoris tenuis]
MFNVPLCLVIYGSKFVWWGGEGGRIPKEPSSDPNSEVTLRGLETPQRWLPTVWVIGQFKWFLRHSSSFEGFQAGGETAFAGKSDDPASDNILI